MQGKHIHKGVILAAIVALVMQFPAAAHAQQKPHSPGDKTVYSDAIPDLPLMDGMKEQAPDKDAQDQQQQASGPGDVPLPKSTTAQVQGNDKQVITYYHQKLTDMGWKPTDSTMHTYTRDGKTMSINTDYRNGNTTVQFQVVPNSQADQLAPAQVGGTKVNTPLAPNPTAVQPMRN
ncbi:MAG: hypothetical protein GC185_09900 [Alphaproteobacteria bacterium]|nr:hypothetical protein [Alphaproteobacteria bacterium]